LKPTMALHHKGGRRFDVGSPDYQLLRDWIAEGCHEGDSDLKCIGITVFPSEARLLKYPRWQQQFSVMANFSDGTRRDVTRLATYGSSDENVASVDQDGLATAHQRGEAAVLIRYLSHVASPLMTVVRDDPNFVWPEPPSANYVDELVYAKLRKMQYPPAPLCSDREFVRRVFLDVIGLLPTPAETRAFLAEPSPQKRGELIDELLGRQEYAKFWAQKWGDLLRVSKKLIGTAAVFKLNRWLEYAVSSNMPYDRFARELLLSSGSTHQQPTANYFKTAVSINDVTETTTQVFLGTRIQCANCHNHPYEPWTQDDYYGLAAFFGGVQRTKTIREQEQIVWTSEKGDVTHPTTGMPTTPWVPVVGTIEIAPNVDPRVAFVDWLTDPSNRFFAHTEVNRLWAQLMGRGIVEPFDDFRDSNPPSHPKLLEALATDFREHGYDRRHILRSILNRHTYQASAHTNRFNQSDNKYFSHYMPRMLTAEQLVDAIGQVMDRPETFVGVPVGTKATWLPAPDLKPHDGDKLGEIEFLKVF